MSTNKDLFFKYLGLPSSKPVGIEIERAKGIYLYDEKGKEYIDLVSGISVSNIGHLHPKVVEAINEQLTKYMHLMVFGEYIQSPQVLLAKLLTDFLPSNLNSVYFVNSGSEANEGAIKLAKRFTRRTEIIAFINAYHGSTHGALSVLGNETLKNSFRPLLPDIKFIQFNNFNDLAQVTERTACVIAESVQAEAGVILPKPDYFSALQQKCNETGSLLILDDIQMGFGRTGKLFSFENFNFIPDILTIAKGMGGGMPIGAFISRKQIMNTLTFGPELGHITTFGGHPVSCAAAIANLKVITEDHILPEVNKKGTLFKSAFSNNQKIKQVRQIGLMLGLDLQSIEFTDRLVNEFINNGLLTDRFLFRPFAFRIAPPLNINFEEIEKIVSLINKCIKKL
jgi:acetylornithine/succinyldiaminopimelate/putrescine aminotransferase